MSAYTATVSLRDFISNSLYHFGVLLPAPALKTLQSFQRELESFQNVAERMNSRSRRMMSDSLRIIAERIREAEISLRSGNLGFLGYGKGSESLIDSLKKIQEEYNSTVLDLQEASSSSNSKIIGLRDEKIKLKEDIVNLRVERSVFTLFGTAGIGKTTLAREIFEDLDISEWFDCRGWVTVGTEWNSEEITEAIRGQIGLEEEDLKKWLEGKRYLIVLDDVWKVDVEVFLRSTFPDNRNGSRVLLTSRIKLTGYHGSLMFRQFEKRLLDKEESWHLLCELVFDGNTCPSELVEAGKKISEKCDGLPLTIVTVADLLSKDEEEPESLWFDVAEQKKHYIFTEAYDQMSEVLYPSYKELIDKFKLCFLYMGVFPLKYKIPASKLINLWIVEDVVEPSMISTTESSLESHAAEFLQLLDYRCLIKVHLRSTSASPHIISAKIKTCSLHSSMWYFCQREARETNFFHVLDCYDDAFEEGMDCQSRLSFHNNILFALKDVYDSIEENCAFTVQSLLCFGPYNQYMVPLCFGLKLLVRLDALNIRFYDFPIEVLELVKLRYLSLTCNGKLPPSVSQLGELQYLIVHRNASINSCGAVSNYPMEIWEMETLKHLQVLGCDLPDLGDSSLLNLSTLSAVSTASCVVLKRVPNLRKLGLIIERTPDGTDPLSFFDHISHLTRLESLKCVIVNPEWKLDIYPPVGSFPCLPFTLKKLSLSGLGYHWDEMSNIASLPNLEILKLRYSAFRGPKWEVDEHGFQKLCFLLIEDVDLVILKCALESFKCLKVLKIEHCYKLKELYLGKLENIEKIEINESNPLTERIVKGNLLEKRFKVGHLLVHFSWNSKEKESRR